MSELPTEAEVLAALTEVQKAFSESWPVNTYTVKIQKYANASLGTNWSVAGQGVALGKPGDLASFQAALDEVHDKMPMIV